MDYQPAPKTTPPLVVVGISLLATGAFMFLCVFFGGRVLFSSPNVSPIVMIVFGLFYVGSFPLMVAGLAVTVAGFFASKKRG